MAFDQQTFPEWSPRRLFVVALVVGSVSMAFGIVFEGWVGVCLTVLMPLAMMAFYAWASYQADASSVLTTEFADSLYYLGFLFTLVALGCSLLSIDTASSGAAIDGVIYRFGVALLTTIVGLTARIYLMNFRETGEDAAARVEHTLSAAAETARFEFEQLTQYALSQQEVLHGQLRHSLDTTGIALTAAAEAAQKGLVDATRNILDSIEKTSGSLEDKTTTLMAHAAGQLSESLDRVRESSQEFVRKVEGVSLPADIFSAELADPLQHLNEHMASYDAQLVDVLNGHEKLNARLHTLEPTLTAIGEGMERSAQAIGRLYGTESSMNRLNEQISTMAGALEQCIVSVVRYDSRVKETVLSLETTTEPFEAIGSEITAVTAQITEAGTQLRESAGEMKEQALAFISAREMQAEALASVRDTVSDELNLLRQHTRALKKQVTGSEKALQEIVRQFTTAAEAMTQVVKAKAP